MKSKMIRLLLIVTVFTACTKVPITKRKQMNLLPEGELISMSLTNYREFLQQHPAVTSGTDAQMVKSVGAKIQGAVSKYMGQNGYSSRIQGYKWEFNLVN